MSKRIFIGWDMPLCETVSERILRGLEAGLADLRGVVIVVPTRQAGYRLRASLPLAAEARGVSLLGPEIKTASVLLAPPSPQSLANSAQILAAWDGALAAVKSGEMTAFLGAGEQRVGSAVRRLQTARHLEKLRAELSDGELSIAAVAASGKSEEAERWADMSELERRFVARLGAAGLSDPVAAKVANAESGKAPDGLRKIILAATPDPPKLLVALLKNYERQGIEIEILVGAPESESDAFGDWGEPLPEKWRDREQALDESKMFLESTPEAQARRVASILREGMPAASAANGARPMVAIGVPDRETIAPLRRELAGVGITVFDPRQKLFSKEPLCRLLNLLPKLAAESGASYDAVSELLRHPYVLRCFGKNTRRVLSELDAYQSERIPVSLDDIQPEPDEYNDALRAALAALREWRGILRAKPLHAALREVVRDIFSRNDMRVGGAEGAAFQAAAETFNEILSEFERGCLPSCPETDVSEILTARLADAKTEPKRLGEALDLEGWLELAWNPAPTLFVTGMNEGFVPDGAVGDVFLPDSLRAALGLRDDNARLARDAFVLAAILAQRESDGGAEFLPTIFPALSQATKNAPSSGTCRERNTCCSRCRHPQWLPILALLRMRSWQSQHSDTA